MTSDREILLDLADTLEVAKTLKNHGIGHDTLREILYKAAHCVPAPEARAGADLFTINVDGAARGNPGPAGAGFIIRRGGKLVEGQGQYLGQTTNNQAEYRALLLALKRALDMGMKRIRVLADSELLVKQIKGSYKVRNARLAELHGEIKELVSAFDSFEIAHVKRESNSEADRMANRAIDEFENDTGE